ncbi:MAG: hypothetical protein MZV64_23375 [Ignavibacteriales bacterium]|nr:hypothetical protein [Ignavibacteriales bacterium]
MVAIELDEKSVESLARAVSSKGSVLSTIRRGKARGCPQSPEGVPESRWDAQSRFPMETKKLLIILNFIVEAFAFDDDLHREGSQHDPAPLPPGYGRPAPLPRGQRFHGARRRWSKVLARKKGGGMSEELCHLLQGAGGSEPPQDRRFAGGETLQRGGTCRAVTAQAVDGLAPSLQIVGGGTGTVAR